MNEVAMIFVGDEQLQKSRVDISDINRQPPPPGSCERSQQASIVVENDNGTGIDC
jgi:hypothetical protein